MRRHLPLWIAAPVLLAAAPAVFAALLYRGILYLNHLDPQVFPVRGVDVSSWQGEIDWRTLGGQEIDFAFIKATEGSSHTDRYFAANWEQAHNTGLLVGAYHFFSFDSGGNTQADHFIATVPVTPGALPPVVDFEFYGDKEQNLPDPDDVAVNLQAMLDRLEARYGQPPILCATAKSYRLYLGEGYGRYPVWIRDIFRRPTLPDGREWAFWQYTNRGRLAGYEGDEPFIDLNVYNGAPEELEQLCAPQ